MADAAAFGTGAHRVIKRETVMQRIRMVVSVVSLVASTCAFAQTSTSTNSTGGKAAQGGAQQAQPGTAGRSMGNAAASGDKSASGTLMQQREKGMSPQGASGGDATGSMKQQ